MSRIQDLPSYSNAHPVPNFSQYLRLTQLVKSGRMGRNAFAMIQGLRTEGKTKRENPVGKTQMEIKTSAIPSVLFYDEQPSPPQNKLCRNLTYHF